ncbi:MAG: hypothetical protein NUK54_10875 [Methanothrix sp.]|nr:hypothetical protein [Methanothrix sp.]
MKRILVFLGCLLALPSLAMAIDDPVNDRNCTGCTGFIEVEKGEEMQLDGTPDQSPSPSVDVNYTWSFWNITYSYTGEDCDIATIQANTGFENWTGSPLGGTVNTGVVQFLAPTTAGCYMAVLTLTYNDTYDDGGEVLTLGEQCIDYACFVFCVNETDCPSCYDIFCEYDCDEFPTLTSNCSDYYPDGLCYSGSMDSVTVKWYILNNYPTDITLETAYYESDTDPCWDLVNTTTSEPIWCDGNGGVTYPGTNVYYIVMGVYDINGNLIVECPVGSVKIVEEPAAAISGGVV